MAFENDDGIYSLPYEGAGPHVWNALINAVIAGQHNSFGYTLRRRQRGLPRV